jgi:hydrogenase maturation protease
LVLGIGNELLCDDAAGLELARMVYDALAEDPAFAGTVDMELAALAGWRLIDLLAGYESAIVLDCVKGGPGKPGDCYDVSPYQAHSENLRSSHGMGFVEAMELARATGIPMPANISIYAIEAPHPDVFGAHLSQEVAERLPDATRQIVRRAHDFASTRSA